MEAAPDALPYHWLELGEMLLEAAPDDFEDADSVRKLLRGLREVRMAKLRRGVEVLDAGGGVQMNGVGGMEVAEGRSFVTGVIDGLRYVSAGLCACCRVALEHRQYRFTNRRTERSQHPANNSAKTVTVKEIMDIPGQLATMMMRMTRWTCSNRESASRTYLSRKRSH